MTLTYITRMEGPGVVNIYSYTKRLRFAALPGKDTAALFALIQPLYPEIQQASSVLETALSNLNAIFHPQGMMMMRAGSSIPTAISCSIAKASPMRSDA